MPSKCPAAIFNCLRGATALHQLLDLNIEQYTANALEAVVSRILRLMLTDLKQEAWPSSMVWFKGCEGQKRSKSCKATRAFSISHNYVLLCNVQFLGHSVNPPHFPVHMLRILHAQKRVISQVNVRTSHWVCRCEFGQKDVIASSALPLKAFSEEYSDSVRHKLSRNSHLIPMHKAAEERAHTWDTDRRNTSVSVIAPTRQLERKANGQDQLNAARIHSALATIFPS